MALILREAKIRLWWVVFCFFITWATCYWFSEDFFYGLATPYLKISNTSFFICTQITESLNTYIIIANIIGFLFCTPYILYQCWCFFIPSCNQTQRARVTKIAFMSIVAFFLVLIITFIWVLPAIWLFLYKLSNTESGAEFFKIQLQPKIYDFSILTLRILFISSVCSQIPIMVVCSIEYNFISIKTLKKSRGVFGLVSLLLAALITPPDVWSQLLAWLSIFILIELAIFTAIVQQQYMICVLKMAALPQ